MYNMYVNVRYDRKKDGDIWKTLVERGTSFGNADNIMEATLVAYMGQSAAKSPQASWERLRPI